MRRVFLVLAAAMAALIAALILAPFLLRGKVKALILQEAGERLRADVSLQRLDLGLLRSFPHLSVTIEGLSVDGRAPFEGVRLLGVDEATMVVDLGALTRDTLDVRRLTLVNPSVDLQVDAQGRSNLEALNTTGEADPLDEPEAPDADAATQAPGEPPWTVRLRELSVQDLQLSFDDRESGTRFSLEGLHHGSSAELTSTALSMESQTRFQALSLRQGGVDLLRRARGEAVVGFRLSPEGELTLQESTFTLNDLTLVLQGVATPEGDDLALDLSFQARETDFKSLLSLVPAVWSEDFAGLEASGSMWARGHVKGTLRSGELLPSFEVEVGVKDGRFQYPDLPLPVEDVQLSLAVTHPGAATMDAMEIDLLRLHMAVARGRVEGSLRLLHPVSDPDLQAVFKADLDLDALARALPDGASRYGGSMEVDLDIAGRMSAFEAEDIGAVRARGRISLAGMPWEDPDLPLPLMVERLDLTLDPREMDISTYRIRFGESDISGTARLENVLPWLLADAVLAGSAEIRSETMDLRPFSDEEPGDAPGADDEAAGVVAVPQGYDLAVRGSAGRVLYGGYVLTDVKGAAEVKDGVLRLRKISMGYMGGEVVLDGSYAAPTEEAADVDMRLDLNGLPLAETVGAHETLQVLAPFARSATGHFGGNLNIKARLGPDLAPNLETLSSRGTITTRGVKVEPRFMAAVAEKIGSDRLSRLELADSDLSFRLDGGRIRMEPFRMTVGGFTATMAGTSGVLDQTLDLRVDMELPAESLRGSQLLERANVAEGKLPVAALVGGTWDGPTVRLDLESARDAVLDTVVSEVLDRAEEALAPVREEVDRELERLVEEARKKGDQLVAEVKKAAARLETEAGAKAAALRAEARNKGDRLKAEAAGNPIKERAASEAASQLTKEANRAAGKMEAEARDKGEAMVAAAEKERDRLVREAESGTQAERRR